MAVQIKVDQVAAPAGVPGQAREDLALGVGVTLTAVGGPYLSYLWRIVDLPTNAAVTVRSAAVLATQQTILGSRAGNAALADLLTKLALSGIIVDGTGA